MSLSAKQARFAAEYVIDLNACQAAIRAGYSAKAAETNGPRLLRNAQVAAEVQRLQREKLDASGLTAARVLEEMRRLAFSDVRGFFDAKGNLKEVWELTPEQGAALASVEVIKKNITTGDGEIDTIHKIKTWDKPRSLEMLAKHFGLLVEKIDHEHSGQIEFVIKKPW